MTTDSIKAGLQLIAKKSAPASWGKAVVVAVDRESNIVTVQGHEVTDSHAGEYVKCFALTMLANYFDENTSDDKYTSELLILI